MGIKECNVHRDISVIDLESHRDVAHGGTRVAAMEVSEALLIIRVQVGHDESRGNEEVAAEAVKVGPDCLDAKDASTAGGGHTSREHRWEEVIGKAKKGAAAAEDAVIPDALALECIIALSELRVDVVDAVKLKVGYVIELGIEALVLEFEAHSLRFMALVLEFEAHSLRFKDV